MPDLAGNLKGNRYDVSTLLDLAVVDPVTGSLVLRAGGVDTRAGTATLVNALQAQRAASSAGYDAAADAMITHFSTALTAFEAQVKAGTANVQVAQSGGGGGSVGWVEILGLLLLGVCSSGVPKRCASIGFHFPPTESGRRQSTSG